MEKEYETLKVFASEKVRVQDKVLGVSISEKQQIEKPVVSPYHFFFVFSPAINWKPTLARGPSKYSLFLKTTKGQFA